MTDTTHRRRPWIRLETNQAPAPAFNLPRKIYHTFGLIIPLALYFDIFRLFSPESDTITREICLVLLAIAVGLMFGVDTLRFSNAKLNALFLRVLGPLLKQEERKRYNATIPYFLACFLLMLVFSDVVVVLACIYLMIGDPWAAYVGGRYARVRFWNGKSLEGLLAFVVLGFAGCVIFLWVHAQNPRAEHFLLAGDALLVSLVVLFGVVAAAIAEFFSGVALRGIFDDNLIVPLSGAAGIVLAAWLLADWPAAALWFEAGRLF